MRPPVVCALLVCTACASSSQPAPSGEPAPAPAAATRTARYTPGTTRYRIVSHTHQEQQIQGTRRDLEFLLESLLTATIASEAGGMRATIVFDSIRAEGGMISPSEVARMKGVRLTGAFAPDGQITSLSGDSALSGQLQTIAANTRLFFPRIPAQGAEPGQQWSDTVETKTTAEPRLVIRSFNNRKALDWTEQGGKRALRIEVNTEYTLSGSGQQMGQDYTLEGKGVRLSTQYLGADGHYLGATSRDSSNVTVSVSSQGISFASIQLRADTVAVIP